MGLSMADGFSCGRCHQWSIHPRQSSGGCAGQGVSHQEPLLQWHRTLGDGGCHSAAATARGGRTSLSSCQHEQKVKKQLLGAADMCIWKAAFSRANKKQS